MVQMESGVKFPYWIVVLGEIDSRSKLYQWAVVSDPLGIDLFILARDVDDFHSKYEEDVLALVASRGFKHIFNSPIQTYQSDQCAYPPVFDDDSKRQN